MYQHIISVVVLGPAYGCAHSEAAVGIYMHALYMVQSSIGGTIFSLDYIEAEWA